MYVMTKKGWKLIGGPIKVMAESQDNKPWWRGALPNLALSRDKNVARIQLEADRDNNYRRCYNRDGSINYETVR